MSEAQQRQLFSSLHSTYQDMVLQLCTGFMKGDNNLANDLMQEIFINTWNALPGYRGEAAYKTWIYRITVNTCLQYLRKEKGKIKVTAETLEKYEADETNAVAKDDYGNLYRAIGALNSVDRLVIMMVLDELEYKEISKVIGISEVNLRVKICRIKQRLKKTLKNEK